MQPSGVPIEPDRPSLPEDDEGLALLRAVRGRASDAAGLVDIELDAVGDLVDVTVSDLAAQQSGSALAGAFREAFTAARAEVTARLEEHAEELTARARRSDDANLARLESIAAQATEQMDAIVAKLSALGGAAGRG